MFSTGKLEEGQYQPLQNTSTYFTPDQINVIKPIFYQSSLTQRPEMAGYYSQYSLGCAVGHLFQAPPIIRDQRLG